MRILAALVTASLIFCGPTFAASEPAPAPPAAEPEAPPKSVAVQLDELFQTLKTEKDAAAAKQAEVSIQKLWLQSGSDTIDLLMGWSIRAMTEKEYALALDYLDRITTLKPDFAEGWNKRATVYFLLEDYARSIADIQKTLALEPRHFGALSGLGMILSTLGEKLRAIDAYKQALAVDPHLDKVREALEQLEKETGRDI
jgi:tetratricopeptide (TPR) repeat protein